MKNKSDYKTILYDVADHVLTITLNRPDKLNSFTRLMMQEMVEAFDRSDADPDIRAVIVTGTGRVFCSGFDLESSAAFDQKLDEVTLDPLRPDHPMRDVGGLLTLRIFESQKPVIGAVNGPAAGIGATMLLPMDFRVASATAKFGFVFTRRGIVPEAASSWFLPRVVGINLALDWAMTGRFVPVEEAREAGLIRSVHEADDLLLAARAIAAEIATKAAPVSVSLTRHMLWRGLTLNHPMDAHRIDSRLIAACGSNPDTYEGVAAFLEKRNPSFPGRVPDDLPSIFPWWPKNDFS